MDLAPIHILIICFALAVPLFVWVLWRAVSRLRSPGVPLWEKVVGISAISLGAVVAWVQWPVIGIAAAGLGLIVLVGPSGGAAAAGGAVGGGGGGC